MSYTGEVPPATLPADLEHHHAVVNGIRMHYVSAGHGEETILFLHGFPEFWYSWRHQLAEFAPDYRVIAPDLRGYNETENKPPYDTDTLQRDVLELLDALDERQVHLVAHDWGAVVAWLLAMHHPARFKSLTICNVPHPAVFERGIRRNPRQMLRSWYILFFQSPWVPERAVAIRNYHVLARTLIHDCRPETFTRDDIKMFLAAWRRQGLAGGINWYRAAIRNRRRLPEPVPVITVPTLMVWGERDLALGKELTVGTGEYVENLRIEFLPESSHWVQQDDPARVNELIREHVGGSNGSGRD